MEFLYVVLIFLVIVALNSRLVYNIDGDVFYIGKHENSKTRAEQLHRMKRSLDKVIAEVSRTIDQIADPTVKSHMQRLLSVYKHVTFSDHTPATQTAAVAYNQDKRHIYLCLERDEIPVTDQALLFVALHEIAHCAIEEYDPQNKAGQTIHSEAFVAAVDHLYNIAERLDILNRGEISSTNYCGQRL